MKRIGFIYGLLFCLVLSVAAQEKVVKLKIVETSDVHGNYYPYNFITRHEWKGSLARIYSFVQKEREKYKENLILLDNGDILQGQPTAYYYNYIDTVSPHLCSQMMNFMKYDAGNMGNHDVETGRAVFDRWIATCDFPVLGANIIDTSTGKPHLAPYKVLERDGVKIVVLGMITPAIPAWLSENLWKGLRFDDMEETARRRFTPCAKENQMEAIIAARPINKPNTDPPADPLAAPKINVPTPSAHAILETTPPIMPDRKYSILRIRPSNEKGALNIIY